MDRYHCEPTPSQMSVHCLEMLIACEIWAGQLPLVPRMASQSAHAPFRLLLMSYSLCAGARCAVQSERLLARQWPVWRLELPGHCPVCLRRSQCGPGDTGALAWPPSSIWLVCLPEP